MALTAKKVYAILKRQISDMEAKLNSPVRYRGTVATADLLPLNPDIGDMYNIESKSVYGEAGMNVAWNGVLWDTMGAPIDMSLYIKSSELADWVKQQNKPTYTANEVGALPADTKIPSKTSELKNDSGFLTKVPDSYLNGTDTTLKESGKAADAKTTGDKFTEMSADISKKLDKNQGSENSGKIAGINEAGDIVPMFPIGVEYNSETNCLEFGSDQKMELNQGIGLDSSLTKTGYAADAGVVGEVTNSLKESISTKITKFYASSQGETHLADSDNGKIMDMMLYGKSEQKQYSGKNLFTFSNDLKDVNGVIFEAKDGIITAKGTSTGRYTNTYLTFNYPKDIFTIGETYTFSLNSNDANLCLYALYKENDMTDYKSLFNVTTKCATVKIPDNVDLIIRCVVDINATVNATATIQIEKGSTATSYEPYTGGQPSPSPDYPQEIKSVVNPTVKVCGKNLYPDGDLIELTKSYTTDFIPAVFDRNIIYLAFECNTNTVDGKYYINIIYYDKNKQKLGSNGSAGQIGEKITKIEDSSSFSGIGAGNGGTNVDLKKVSYVKIVFNIYNNTATKITYKNIVVSSTPTAYEPYHEQTATLPYDLYGVKVPSGGNVTIDGQEYVSDYFDVERGKLVRRVKEKSDTINITVAGSAGGLGFYDYDIPFIKNVICNITNIVYEDINQGWVLKQACISGNNDGKMRIYLPNGNHSVKIIYELETPEEIDLTTEEIAAFKALATYYPTTNISVNSEQLDGYTVFNYPISMENGWDYVKQQINDNREYIYNMDARTQDTDLQAAEAYVNSEYAVALTELEAHNS